MEEIWRPTEYDGYEVSNFGRVKSYKIDKINGRILKANIDSRGYLQIDVWVRGENGTYRLHPLVHRLVAKAFIPNPDNLPLINHKDENKLNNNISNLEWCTYEYNIKYGTRIERVSKKTRKPIYSIDENGNIEEFDGIKIASNAMRNDSISSDMPIRYALKTGKTAYGRKWFYKENI